MPSIFTFTSLSLPSVPSSVSEPLNAGAANDTAEDIFRKHFNPAINSFEPGWDALIKAITVGDQYNFDNAKYGIDQLFIHSASGLFLDRRGSDQGVTRLDSVGLTDELFRRLVITTSTNKVVSQALLEALEVFYSQDSTRGYLISTAQPYALQTGWDIQFSIDSGDPITIPFVTADFLSIGTATAKEVAAVLTRWMSMQGLTSYAVEHTDSTTGLKCVKVVSGTLGLESSVQIVGGRAQNVLQFSTLLTRTVVGNSWAVRNSTSHPGVVSPGFARFSINGATTTDLNLVHVGDYVNIYGANFKTANVGSFPITNVDVRYDPTGVTLTQYFEVELDGSVSQTVAGTGGSSAFPNLTIATTSDMIFFRPTEGTVNSNGVRAVIVSQTSPEEVIVQMPATTTAVNRTVLTGAYANVNTASVVTDAIRLPSGHLIVNTLAAHGITTGGQVILDGIEPDVPVLSGSDWVVPGSIVTAGGATTTDSCRTTIKSDLDDPGAGFAASSVKSVLLENGDVFFCGGEFFSAGPVDNGAIKSCFRLRVDNPTDIFTEQTRYDYTWIATADLPTVREKHTATLLTSPSQPGNVLVAGGASAGVPLATSYVYDVPANTWSANIPMVVDRFDHVAVGLNDDRVLVAGGDTGTIVATCEIFTPVALAPGGSWAATGSMALARKEFSAIKLASGRVLVMGGLIGVNVVTEKCELFDPVTETFSSAGSMGYARAKHAAVLLPGDKVFVWGGYGNLPTTTSATPDAYLNMAEIYDGATGRWSPVPSNPNRSMPTSASYVPDEIAYLADKNQVIVVGRGIGRIDIFDVTTKKWLPSLASLIPAADGVRYPSLTALTDYPVVVMAGGGNNAAFPGVSIRGARLYLSSGDVINAGGINGKMLQTASAAGSSLTIELPESASFMSALAPVVRGSATRVKQAAATTIPGPYIFDPDSGFAITGISSLTTSAINAGTKYRDLPITAASASNFTDEEGWLVFGFGTATQFGPVKYVGVKDANTLLLNYDTQFPEDFPVGSSVVLLSQKGPFVPTNPAAVGSLYVTDSSSGRVAAGNTLDEIVAEGISLVKNIIYPSDVGLGAAGSPVTGQKLSDIVETFAGNDIDGEITKARGS